MIDRREIIVYTDGSCSGNGKKHAVGGIGVYFPNREMKNISKIYRLGVCTNNATELFAILTAIRYIKKNIGLDNCKIIIKTDSQYSIDCVTKWVNNWIKNGWRTKNDTPVSNQELIEKIHNYIESYDIEFEHVFGHEDGDDPDTICNNKADKLATQATERAINENKKNIHSKNKTTTRSRTNFGGINVELISLSKKPRSNSKTSKKKR